MPVRSPVSRVDCPLTPLEVAQRWPLERPLMALISGRHDARWARWSILASPRGVFRHDGFSQWSGAEACPIPQALSHEPMTDLDRAFDSTRTDAHAIDGVLPFVGGWIGYLSYDLGRAIEPAADIADGATADRSWPLFELAWCPDAMVYNHTDRSWWTVGGAAKWLDDLTADPLRHAACRFDEVQTEWNRAEHERAVEQTVGHIAAGDIFQANITGRMTTRMYGTPRGLATAALSTAESWYGALLEFDDRALLSLSPELFLDFDAATSRAVSRPIKGTLPATADPSALLHSEKDAAELAMIVDLMRNDLGRVCRYGTVCVRTPRSIERHPTVWQAVAEIEGTVRSNVTHADILAATFPPGSVTGAPKIRAMQIIDELEPVRRGPYCGAIGYFSRCGSFRLNVAIRTLAMLRTRSGESWRVDYSSGGGIVADSTPGAEYEEAMTKAEIFRRVIRSTEPATDTPAGIPALQRSSSVR